MCSTFIYENIELKIFDEVYKPAEDTVFLADNLEVEEGERVLEIGTGSGLLAIISALNGADVVATDINAKALACAKENAESAGVGDKIEFRLGDIFEPVRDESFETIIFNPPYLPVPEDESFGSIEEKAWNGGTDGREVLDRFLERIEGYLESGGRLYLIQSSLTGISRSVDKLKDIGFKYERMEKKTSFEKIILFIGTLSQ